MRAMEINDPQITVESLTDKLREGARRQASMRDDATSDGASSTLNSPAASRAAQSPSTLPAQGFRPPASPDNPQLTLQPDFEPRDDGAYHVNDLLKYHDRNFVQNAYLAILKRGPDATGYTAFIESLRSGRLNKIDVLARLRYSTEGRAKKVQVSGLFVPAAVRQLYRLPLVGYLLRLGVGIIRLPSTLRHQQQFEAHFHAQQQQVVDLANHLSASLGQQRQETKHGLTQIELLGREQQQALKTSLLKQMDEVKRQTDVLIEEAIAQWQGRMQQLEARQNEQHERAIQLTNSLRAQLELQAAQLTDGLRADLTSLALELRVEIERIFQKEQEVRTELTMQRGRVARLLEEVGKRLPAPFDKGQLEKLAEEQPHLDDAFYYALEESFRGSTAEIKERLKVYLPLVEEARLREEARPLLDIGCGRGDWLELLRDEAQVSATGVDSNSVLVAEGRARGLSVVEMDVMDYLRDLPDASVGALTGFHIVEHLPLSTLLRLLDETVRVVKPGGLLIFETPNPENVIVGSCNFYFDPTHRNPLPAPVMKFLLEAKGLRRVRVIRLNPSTAEPVAGDTDLVTRFNQYFYGPMDYAVIGWKI